MTMHDHTKPDIAGMDFGKPVNRRSPHEEGRQRQQLQPFTDYRPIAGRPGWEDDGHGHQRYNGLPDAQRHERAENKREAGLALAQLEQTPLAMLQAFVEAQEREHGDASETWEGILAKANQPGVERVNVYMGGRCGGKSYWNELRRAVMHDVKPQDVPANRSQQEWFDLADHVQPPDRAPDAQAAPMPPIQRLREQTPAQGLIGYTCTRLNNGQAQHAFQFAGDDSTSAATYPIQGCTLTLHEGDTRGDGPLVTWDAEHFNGVSTHRSRATLYDYVLGLHALMKPHGVPVYTRRGPSGLINVWNRRE